MRQLALLLVTGPAVLMAVAAGVRLARSGRVAVAVTSGELAHPGRDQRRPSGPARELYLFGPAARDLRRVLLRAGATLRRDLGRDLAGSWRRWWVRGRWSRLPCLLWVYGTVAGAVLGVVLLAGVALVVIVGALLASAVVLAAVLTLRGIDLLALRARGVRMTCPNCYRAVGYPAYRCPGCGARHRDVRPGRYGVLRRHCRCGEELPTLLLLGSHRLSALCPHPDCGGPLVEAAGTAGELLVPIVGSSGAGKTRLLAAMLRVLAERATAGGGLLEPADAATRRRVTGLLAALEAGAPVEPTPADPPPAHSLYLSGPGVPRRLLRFFDPAGESLADPSALERLDYLGRLGSGDAVVLAVDPFSVDRVRAGLDPRARRRLSLAERGRSSEFVFQQVLDGIERQAVDPGRLRLAVVLTRTDQLRSAAVVPPAADGTAVEQWLDDAGLDNLVRAARHHFGTVAFFRSSTMVSPDGDAEGVSGLLEWLLTPPPGPRYLR